jgi:hypothetical protein
MIKDLLKHLDYGLFQEGALLLFFLIFAVVAIRTLLTRNDVARRQAMVVLNDGTEKDQ